VESIVAAAGLTMSDLFPGAGFQVKTPFRMTLERSNTPQDALKPSKPSVVAPRLATLLDALCGVLRRFVVFPLPEQAEAIALWVAHTWAFSASEFTPYLVVTAASKRSGKSRVLEVLKLLARNPKLTQSGSAAALVRSVNETNPPTILLDEIDRVYSGKGGDAESAQSLCQFLNAGFERGATFLRCVGQGSNQQPKEFPAFCPKAVAGVTLDQCLPDTVQDRSLLIELERQSREHRAERLRKRDAEAVTGPIVAQLKEWAANPEVIDALKAARPDLPDELNDRQQDICEPLVAIAELAGGEWPERGRKALVRLCAGVEDVDLGVKLLADIKYVFDEKGADKLTSKELLDALVAIEDGSPWAKWWSDALKHGQVQIAASSLARKVKRYKIKPRTIKIEGCEETAKGYHRSDFESAWKRYLLPPPRQAVTAVTAVTHEGKKVTATHMVTANYGNLELGGREMRTATESETSRNVTPTGEQAVTGICLGKSGQGYEVTAVTANLNGGPKHDCLTRTDDGHWHMCDVCEAAFNAEKIIYPFGNPQWVKLYPNETQPHWQAAWRRAVSTPCEVCEEGLAQEPHVWLHLTDGVAQCQDCRETQWWADGYETDELGFPYCWDPDHTREQRIAEREYNLLTKATREWKASPKGKSLLEKARRECDRLQVYYHKIALLAV
jgi:hypothetical protein